MDIDERRVSSPRRPSHGTAATRVIAPYIQGAFDQWHLQGARMGLREFLVHYLGRDPSSDEFEQVESLTRSRREEVNERPQERREDRSMDRDRGPNGRGRRGSDRDDRERDDWRDRDRDPVGQRRAWKDRSASPVKPGADVNSIPIPETSMRYKSALPSEALAAPLPRAIPEPPSSASDPILVAKKVLPDGETYERLTCVGEGTYGKVYKARHVVTGGFVALKRIRMEGEKDGFPVTAMREIKLLQGLKHGNVLRLMEMMVSKGQSGFLSGQSLCARLER